MTVDLEMAMKWLAFGQAVFSAGTGAWQRVKDAATEAGVEHDTAALDAVIEDAARRKAQAERDAAGGNSPGD